MSKRNIDEVGLFSDGPARRTRRRTSRRRSNSVASEPGSGRRSSRRLSRRRNASQGPKTRSSAKTPRAQRVLDLGAVEEENKSTLSFSEEKEEEPIQRGIQPLLEEENKANAAELNTTLVDGAWAAGPVDQFVSDEIESQNRKWSIKDWVVSAFQSIILWLLLIRDSIYGFFKKTESWLPKFLAIALYVALMAIILQALNSRNESNTVISRSTNADVRFKSLEQQIRELRRTVNKYESQASEDKGKIPQVKNIHLSIQEKVQNINRAIEEMNKGHQNLADKVTQMNVQFGKTDDEGSGLSLDVLDMIRRQIAHYDADKTNKIDYALHNIGGRVVNSSPSVSSPRAGSKLSFTEKLSTYMLMAMSGANANVILMPGTQPGQCWPMKGSNGFIDIRLWDSITLKSISIEHASRTNIPSMKTAPKSFTVFATNSSDPYTDDFERVGKGTYQSGGASLQVFPLSSLKGERFARIVRLQIDSNHGDESATCIYRVRVHGRSTNEI